MSAEHGVDDGSDDGSDNGVAYAVDAGVCILRLPGPALGAAVRVSLLAGLQRAASSADVRAVVLTGTGRTFSAGHDLVEHHALLDTDPAHAFDCLPEHYEPIIATIVEMPKPVVAAVNGVCAGGGLGLALACDLRIAASTARFAPAFAQIGLGPDCGVSVLLPAVVGAGRAMQILLSAAPFSAEDALRWGLVGEIVAPAELDGAVRRATAAMTGFDPAAVAAGKRLLRGPVSDELRAGMRRETAEQRRLGARPEHGRRVAEAVSRMRLARAERTQNA